MTLVHFAPAGNGTTTPRGYIEGRPVGAGVLPDSFRAVLVNGEVTRDMTPAPIGGLWAWNIIERVDYGQDQYVQFDSAPGTLEYDDLTQVSGDDFSPAVEPGPGWVADLADVEARIQTERRLPANAPATVLGQYDQRSNGYNVKASNTRRIRAALGRAAATGPAAGLARIAVLPGDSKSDQFNGSNTGNGGYDTTFTKWPWRLRERLSSVLNAPIGGTGFVKCYHAGVYDPRWTFTGTWTSLLAGPYSYTLNAGDKAIFSSVDSGETGTTVEVIINDYSVAQVTFSVDGATSGPGFHVETNTNTNAAKKITLSGLPDTTHTVTITNDNAYTFILGACIHSAAGVVVDNFAINGGRAAFYETGQALGDLARFYLPDPDLVICATGPNDLGNHVGASDLTVAQTITDITQVLATYPTSDKLLVIEDRTSNATDQAAWDAKWDDYIGALYELADTLDVPLLDLSDRWGAFDDPIHAAHLIDGVHHDAAEDQDWASAIAALLTSPGGPDVEAKITAASGPVQEADGTPVPGYRYRVIVDPLTPTEIQDIIVEAV